VKEGDFLLAINGVELKAPQTPDELLVGINPPESVTLTVAMLERLRRIQNRLDVNRQRAADSGPNQFMPGPKIVVINHYSVSEGDMFPYLFREYGLGKLLGTRTWGGVRAERGKWAMMDNGYVEIPEWSLYNSKSQWVLENHGVEPDPGMEVENLPGELISGHDKQLETAVAVLLKKISGERAGLPPPPPLLPAYPADGDVPGPAH
jgi:tricorn protease